MSVQRGVKVIIFVLLLAVIMSMTGLAAMYFWVSRAPSVASNAVLMLRVPGGLSERQANPLLTTLVGDRPTVQSVVNSLRKAQVDARIRGVILMPSGPQLLWGKAQEIRDAVLAFRASGKPLVAFLEYGGTQEYYLASAADKVFLMPGSPLDLVGVASYEMFIRGALDKIDAYPDMLHAGDFKTASNFYTETAFTPEHREMAESLNRDLYEQIIDGIADGRRMTKSDVRRLVDEGPFLPADALEAGLVDGLVYADELKRQDPFDEVNWRENRRPRLPADQPRVGRAEPGAAHRAGLRGRHDYLGPRRGRPPGRGGARVRHAGAGYPRRADRRLGARDRVADRQPWWVGGRLRCDLARGDAGESGQAGYRVDVGSGCVGGLLHCHGRRHDRCAAGDADRVDRRRGGQDHDRRHLREDRYHDRAGQRRAVRRDVLAGHAVFR